MFVVDPCEPNFSDEEGFIDEISDSELIPEVMSKKPTPITSFDSIVVVSGLPKTSEEQKHQLEKNIRAKFSTFGDIICVFFPSSSNQTTGCCFIEFVSEKSVTAAVAGMDGKKLGPARIYVSPYTDFKRVKEQQNHVNISKELKLPQWADFNQHLESDHAQLAVIDNNSVEISRVDRNFGLGKMDGSKIAWSPLGTFIAVCEAQGVTIYGGSQFDVVTRLKHEGVKKVEFSPQERFVTTSSPGEVRCWVTYSGTGIKATRSDDVFKFNHNDEYVGRIRGKNGLSIFSLPDFESKLSCTADHFEWIPGRNTVVYFEKSSDRCTFRFVTVDGAKLYSKVYSTMIDVVVSFSRQAQLMMLLSKSRTGQAVNIVRFSENGCPMERVNPATHIHSFSFDSLGQTFAVLHGDDHSTALTIYSASNCSQIESIKATHGFTEICRSPTNSVIVLVDIRRSSLEFYDVRNFMRLRSISFQRRINSYEWDSTGRYFLVTATTNMPGYSIYSTSGRLITSTNSSSFLQASFRPRPPSPLSPAQLKVIQEQFESRSANLREFDEKCDRDAYVELLKQRTIKSAVLMNWLSNNREMVRKHAEYNGKYLNNETNVEQEYEVLVYVDSVVIDD